MIAMPRTPIVVATANSEPITRGTRERSSKRTGGASIKPNRIPTSPENMTAPAAVAGSRAN